MAKWDVRIKEFPSDFKSFVGANCVLEGFFLVKVKQYFFIMKQFRETFFGEIFNLISVRSCVHLYLE
jgi:hypothetical protein